MTPHRPRSVHRHLCRPLYWLAAEIVMVLVIAIFLTRDARTARTQAETWPRVVATVGSGYEVGRHLVPLTFRHPVTGQVVSTEVVVVRGSLLPHPGGPMTVASDPANPDRVRIPNDGDEMTDAAFALVAVTGAVLAVLVARWLGVRQVERLIASGRPSFSMTGRLSRSRSNRRRLILSLFALDAPAGAQAVCAFPVLTTGWAPVAPGFPIEVRGRPVPGGVVVARSGTAIFWPLRRPIGRGASGRPATIGVVPRPPAASSSPPAVAGPRLLMVIGWRLLVLTAAILLLLGVLGPVLIARGRTAERVMRRGTVVWAEPLEGAERGAVAYGAPGQPRRKTINIATTRHPGRIYPAHVDPSRPSDLRLDADPYNVVGPLAWLLALAAVPITLVGLQVGQWRESRRSVLHGPYAMVSFRRSVAEGEVELAARPEHPTVAWFANGAGTPSGEAVIAGTPDPGQPVVTLGSDGATVVLLPPVAKRGDRFRRPRLDRANPASG